MTSFSPWILLKCVLALTSLTAAIGGPPACKYETIDDVNKNNQTGSILDITHQYRPELPSYGSTSGLGLFLRMISNMRNGSKTNTSEMKMVVHTGTHIDAPSHMYEEYFDACYDVDTLDLEVLNGPAMVVDVPRNSNITGDVMKSLNIPRGVRRVLFRTLNTDRQLMWKKEFDTSYVGFEEDGAKWLVENTDIKLVGTDYISIAAYNNIIPAHRVFLKNRDIILVEGLKLDNVPVQENYNLHCLPLRLRGADGSPTRCILMKV